MNNTIAIMRYMQNLEALATAVSDEMKRQNLNTYEVAARARIKGHKIVHGTVWNVINRNVKEVKDKTIIALAYGLSLSEQTLFSILRGSHPGDQAIVNERFSRLAEGFARLSDQEKENLEPFLAAIEKSIDNSSLQAGDELIENLKKVKVAAGNSAQVKKPSANRGKKNFRMIEEAEGFAGNEDD